MAAVIYNCKRCKQGRRVQYDAGRKSNGTKSWPFRRDDTGRQHFPGAFLYGRKADGTPEYEGDPLGLCDGCGKPMAWGELDAFHAPDVRCDARCTNARGFKCDCSCSGKNHGSGWGVGAPSFTQLLAEAA